VNLDGEVVGMNNMKAAAADGVSFAIPINTIKGLLSEISRWEAGDAGRFNLRRVHMCTTTAAL
jgi:S1-C subfamily serine protease